MKTNILQSNNLSVLVYGLHNKDNLLTNVIDFAEMGNVSYANTKKQAFRLFQKTALDVVIIELADFKKIKAHLDTLEGKYPPAYIVLTKDTDVEDINLIENEKYLPIQECTAFTLKQLLFAAVETNVLLGENAAYEEIIQAAIDRRETRQCHKQELLPKLIELRNSIRHCE